MADEESQEISRGGGNHGSQETHVPAVVVLPVEAIQKNVVTAVEATSKKFESLKKTFEGVSARIDFIHKFMLDLGNYFFAFQGVCLAAMSNTSFFVCHNAWVLTTLSILSALPSLAALGFLAHEWIELMQHLDTLLANLDAIGIAFGGDYAQEFYSFQKYYSALTGYKYSFKLRYFLLVVGVVIILGFTVTIAVWPHIMSCKNNAGNHFDKKGFN